MNSHATEHDTHDNATQPAVLHEVSSVYVKPVVVFALVLIVVSLATFATVRVLLDYFQINQARTDVPLSPLADPQQLPPTPRLQVSSGDDLLKLRAQETEVLHSYAWVDQNAGIVRIPIERAMTLLAEKGLPSRETATLDK
ncbi:MAG: hypothetical protein AB7G75_01540 [Candidatus Binatia bacterium]